MTPHEILKFWRDYEGRGSDAVVAFARAIELALREHWVGAWQPIKTAPRDGTAILVTDGIWQVGSAYFDYGGWCSPPRSSSNYIHYTPVQWTPLPTPTTKTMGAAFPPSGLR